MLRGMKDLRILTGEDVRAALPMPAAIEAMREAFAFLARDAADLPERVTVHSPPHDGVTLVMPGRVPLRWGLGAKLVSVFPRNVGMGRPAVQGVVVLLDDETGTPAAVLDGTALTALRTGAASGLATDLLAPADARAAAIIGSGMQARTQLEAICTVRRIATVRVWSRTPAHADRFVQDMRGHGPVPEEITVADSAAAAVARAEIICTATSAAEPVLAAADVPDGAHVNAVGSFTPAMQEFDPALLGDARVVVDQRKAALAEAGEVIAGVRMGLLGPGDLEELGSLVVNGGAGRTGRVSVFKSVGLAVQDLVAGARALAGWRDGPGGDSF